MLHHFVQAVASWHQARKAIHELNRLSDAQLGDLGIRRADIASIVSVSSMPDTPEGEPGRDYAEAMAPAWGTHNRRALAA